MCAVGCLLHTEYTYSRRYTREVIRQYNALFTDMDALMARLNPLGGPGGSKVPVDYVLHLMRGGAQGGKEMRRSRGKKRRRGDKQ